MGFLISIPSFIDRNAIIQALPNPTDKLTVPYERLRVETACRRDCWKEEKDTERVVEERSSLSTHISEELESMRNSLNVKDYR